MCLVWCGLALSLPAPACTPAAVKGECDQCDACVCNAITAAWLTWRCVPATPYGPSNHYGGMQCGMCIPTCARPAHIVSSRAVVRNPLLHTSCSVGGQEFGTCSQITACYLLSFPAAWSAAALFSLAGGCHVVGLLSPHPRCTACRSVACAPLSSPTPSMTVLHPSCLGDYDSMGAGEFINGAAPVGTEHACIVQVDPRHRGHRSAACWQRHPGRWPPGGGRSGLGSCESRQGGRVHGPVRHP